MQYYLIFIVDNAIDTDLDEIDKIQLPPEPDGVHSLSVQVW